MREIMAEDGSIDVAAAYEAAVPLSGRMALLDTIAAELGKRGPTADYYQPLRDGRLRLLAYQAQRRLDEPPVLLPVDLVDKVVAGWKQNPDPDRTIDRLTRPRPNLSIGKPPGGSQKLGISPRVTPATAGSCSESGTSPGPFTGGWASFDSTGWCSLTAV